LAIEEWYTDDIWKWYNEAIKLETEKYKAIADGMKGKKNE
jgi:hypothetical protein